MLLENVELIQTAESIAEEKGIEKELVFQAIEKAIDLAALCAHRLSVHWVVAEVPSYQSVQQV